MRTKIFILLIFTLVGCTRFNENLKEDFLSNFYRSYFLLSIIVFSKLDIFYLRKMLKNELSIKGCHFNQV